MKELKLTNLNGTEVVDSRQVAEAVGKAHKNLLQDIRTYCEYLGELKIQLTDYERHELLLKAKPILFNTEMVRAILDGRKTVTRRVLKPQPEKAHNIMDYDNDAHTVDFHCGNCTPNGTFIDWTKTVKAPY